MGISNVNAEATARPAISSSAGRKVDSGLISAGVQASAMPGLVERVVRRLLRPLVETGTVTFFVRDLGEAEPGPPELPGITIRRLRPGPSDVLLYGTDPARSPQALAARFEAGDLCFAALDEHSRALHTRWVTLTRAYVPELHRDFEPGSHGAYSYDAY